MNPTLAKNEAGALEKTRARAERTPAVDIYENEHELLLVADLPGVTSAGLKLAIEPPELRLEAAPEATEAPVFTRSFTIDERIAAGEVTAELKHGVLTVRLPKPAAQKPRQIPIRVAS